MKIAFVEVRDKTFLFAAAGALLANQYEIAWLVQNHAFATSIMANCTVLPYPSRRELAAFNGSAKQGRSAEIAARVSAMDRFTTTFGRQSEHYSWYYDQIENWFDAVQPDVVIGEVGNFHSHIASCIAQDRDIPFLNPLGSRYPTGRFSCFLYDRLVPVGGDASTVSSQSLQDTYLAIRDGTRAPDYMTLRRRPGSAAANRLRVLKEWAKGERFATQSPLSFARQRRRLTKIRARWDSGAIAIGDLASLRSDSKPLILYPLQMQPELNLDIWACRHRDQAATVRALQRGSATLVVKPNPKSFHELTPELLEATESRACHRLPHGAAMVDVEPVSDLVVTASGTIAIERLLRNRPVAILEQDYADWLGVPSASDLDVSLDEISTDVIGSIQDSQSSIDPINVLSRLATTSYPGVISEPRLVPDVLNKPNVGLVAAGIRHVIDEWFSESRR